MSKKISVIVTTYNSPNTLRLVLLALANQTSGDFEVIVADDGSTEATKLLLEQLKTNLPYKLSHVWQEDEGYRVAMIRNKATAFATGEYLIFLDGDSVPRTSFIARHKKLAEYGWFVVGNRILLTKDFTEEVLHNSLAIFQWHFWQWLKVYLQKNINRLLPLIYLPLNNLRKLQKRKWQGAKTCNLGIWKKDFLAINGFDENFSGWGFEDSDLVIRLIRNGILRKDGHFAIPVLHLWHQENSRTNEKANLARLHETINSQNIVIEKGVKQYL